MPRRSMLAVPLSALAVVLTVLPLSWWERRESGALRKARDQNVELSRQTAAAARRGEAKTLVVRRLLAGRLTLFEAAAWFRHIDEATADYPAENWNRLKGCTQEEKICRQVINWAVREADEVPTLPRGLLVGGWLEADLADHTARHGKVIIPDLPEEAWKE